MTVKYEVERRIDEFFAWEQMRHKGRKGIRTSFFNTKEEAEADIADQIAQHGGEYRIVEVYL